MTRSVKLNILLYTVEGYLDDISKEQTYNYEFMLRIRTAIRCYMTFHRFSPEEHKEVMRLADDPFMAKMTEVLVDRTIFGLELLYLYITRIPKHERANLNIADKKILQLKAELVKDMLKLKGRSADDYGRVKEIVDDSREYAEKYFDFVMGYEDVGHIKSVS